MALADSERDILQRIIDELVEEYGYSKDQITLQHTLPIGRIADAVVFEDNKPLIIIEVKKHFVYPIDSQQIEHYLKTSSARYGLLTDGETKFCFESIHRRVLKIPDIPKRGRKRERTLLKSRLKAKIGLEYSLQKMGDYLQEKGMPSDGSTRELMKLLLCKLTDERSPELEASFWFSPEEAQNFEKLEVRESFAGRINLLFERVKEAYPDLYNSDEKIELEPHLLSSVVSELQDYSFMTMPPETLASAYQNFVIKSTYGYPGEYSTPKVLLHFIIRMLDPSLKETILDPACGTGGFLTIAMHHAWKKMDSTNAARKGYLKSDYARNKLFGIDVSRMIASTCKMNMILHGDGSANIFDHNSLSKMEDLRSDFPQMFDIVVTDPPLSGYISDTRTLSQYSLGRGRKKQRKLILFIERCLRILKKRGRMAIIIPDALLANSSLRYVREFILSFVVPEAIVSFPEEISLFYSGTKMSVIFFRKGDTTHSQKLEVFMAEASEKVESSLEEILKSYRDFKRERKPLKLKRIFTIKPSALYKRWDVSFHKPLKLEFRAAKPLGELCRIMSGSKVPSRRYFDAAREGLVPFLRISDILDGALVDRGLKFVEKEIGAHRVKQGDILLSVRATIGKAAIVSKAFEGSIVGSQIAILHPNRELVNPQYLYRILLSDMVVEQLEKIKIGQFIAYVPLEDLRHVSIPCPPRRKQVEIVRIIDQLEKEAKEKGLTTRELKREIRSVLRASAR